MVLWHIFIHAGAPYTQLHVFSKFMTHDTMIHWKVFKDMSYLKIMDVAGKEEKKKEGKEKKAIKLLIVQVENKAKLVHK